MHPVVRQFQRHSEKHIHLGAAWIMFLILPQPFLVRVRAEKKSRKTVCTPIVVSLKNPGLEIPTTGGGNAHLQG